MKNKIVFWLLGITAIILTSLGYMIDSDPPYASFKTTIFEFTILAFLFWLFLIAIFGLGKQLARLLNTGR